MPEYSIPQGHKQCSGCGQIKTRDEFHRNKSNSDGLQSYCKTCKREYGRSYREVNADKEREYGRSYREVNADKIREYQRRYREENPDKKRESQYRYIEANNDKIREYQRRYREENPDRVRERSRRYREENPDKKRESRRRRRARKQQAIVACPPQIEAVLFDVQNGQCLYCGEYLLNGFHLDHILPLSLVDALGDAHPGHQPSNLCLACEHCNTSKNDALLEDWLSWKYPDQMDEILRRVERHIEIMREWVKE